MDTYTFGRKSLNGHRPRVDRFVAPRESLAELKRRFGWTLNQSSTADIWHAKYLKQRKYMNFLDDAFGLGPLTAHASREELHRPWPCVPRKKCYLSSADSILDLPNYSDATFPELLDWNNDNTLVAALGTNYHKWSWHSQSLISQGVTQFDIQCCKFDPRGELLLLGTKMKIAELHDNALSKHVKQSKCQCFKEDRKICSITAVDWSPTGNSFVTGCERGTLASFSRQARLIRWRHAVNHAVLVVRVSPNARFVAASSASGGAVTVMTWPTLESYCTHNSNWTVKTLSWHPWRSALLAIGSVNDENRACLATWDVPTGKVHESVLGNTPYCLDYMLFSKKTGELVISLWNHDQSLLSPNSCFQLVVLSDPDTMVDQWGEGRAVIDRVRTMVFSPDGTKLATATQDEDLIIWNFLPEDRMKKKVDCKRFCSLPVYLDQASQGYSLR